MAFLFETEERSYRVAAVDAGAGLRLAVDGAWQDGELVRNREGSDWLILDGVPERVFVVSEGDRHFVHLRGESFEIRRVDRIARLREARAAEGGEILSAPMPGVVVELRTQEGREVQAGDTLLVIESMKLQTAIVARVAGRVAVLPVVPGQSFDKGTVLARIEPMKTSEKEPA